MISKIIFASIKNYRFKKLPKNYSAKLGTILAKIKSKIQYPRKIYIIDRIIQANSFTKVVHLDLHYYIVPFIDTFIFLTVVVVVAPSN
ncbi:hypothetical protein BpHYR1_052681 [Brachionus plicatilis]|uniref:Uncharacterized protein n=1 Tax=Brachionus plicatilis TaxID=10195 RepID=A0A3M7Q415_BRAPC|nr:hypothetical protein BpHYR1_052681 [Brachionus plicatilis]